MLKYLMQDLAGTTRYIPYGIVIGVVLLLLVRGINRRRLKQGKEPWRLLAPVCFWTYLALMIIITFLSREEGSTTGMDLEIGSSLKINARNTAYVVENILLFVPYGFCYAWFRKRKGMFTGFFIGFTTSFLIEIMQLVTGRGIFQMDDIITNTVGCVLGAILYQIPAWLIHKIMRN